MRRFLVLVLVVGLLGGSLATSVQAKKKRKKPAQVEVTYWFANTSGGCAAEAYTLVLTEATEGSNCGSLLAGLPWAVAETAGVASPITYYAAEGVPFVLDATNKITGTIQVSSRSVAAGAPLFLGAGQATTIGVVTATTDGEAKELGMFESTYTVTPAQGVYEVEFEIEPPAELDKAEFTSLEIALHTEGSSVNHGYYRTVDPASSINVPTLQ